MRNPHPENAILIPILYFMLTIIACNKSNDDPAPVNPPKPEKISLLKTYTEDIRSTGYNSFTTYNLTYDDSNRLISMAATPEPSIVKFLYHYGPNNSITMDMYNSNVWKIHEVLWLNSSSLVDSSYQYNDTQDTSTDKFIYNGNKELIRYNHYNYPYTGPILFYFVSYTYDHLGNQITKTDSRTGTTTFTYYDNLQNTVTLGQPYIWQTKNLVKTASSMSGSTPVTATHYYRFDSDNRITQDSAVTTGVNAVVVKSYKY